MKEIVSSIIVPKITENTGIKISPIHENTLALHIEKMAEERGITFEEYCDLLVPNTKEFDALVNVATTNETYFFRERLQFEFLQEKVFPAFLGKKLVIWSGACASGEEPISLYSLALSCGVKPEIYASDIDSDELAYFEKGVYTKYSLNQDGKDFHHLLEETDTGKFQDGKFVLNPQVFQSIHLHKYNLASKLLPDFFDKADIIFLRNVFIYFDNNLRKEILAKIAQKLVPGGILFLSVGEICCIGQDLIPSTLEKRNFGKVYYYVKTGEGNPLLKSMLVDKTQNPQENLEVLKSFYSKKIEEKIEKEKNEETQKSKKIEETVTVQGETRKPVEIFLEVNAYLSQGKYSKAYELLEDYNPNYAEKFYKEYFLALTYKADMNYDEAIRHFSIAETICPNFWLAYFNHGFLLKEQDKEIAAKRCFEKCMTYIESYIDSKNTNFDFLSEEFSAEYFYSLCKKYVLGGEEK